VGDMLNKNVIESPEGKRPRLRWEENLKYRSILEIQGVTMWTVIYTLFSGIVF
jgi:hypothetical protein